MPVIIEQNRVATIYNPQNQTKDQLIDGFVAREKTFKKLFKVIKESKMEVPEQHYLISGLRGMGKTTLIMRLFYEIEDDKELSSSLIPLVFNEEEYGIRRLFGFWERILELLEHEIPNFRGNESVRKVLSKKFNDDDDAYERALYNLLTDELTRNGKKIILFVDNFGDLARKLTDAEGHRLRKILQSSADIRIFASSSVVLEAFYKYDHPFYEFFKAIELQGLNENETRNLLLSLSHHYKNDSVAKMVENHPGRIEAIRRITGGVIRTMVLLFEIFADDDDGSAFKDLEKILDRTTPLYKHRMDDLSDQQQAIVEAIATNWDALSVKEIVERTRLDSKTISAQLNNLEKTGIIEKRATTTKNHVYLVAERFFNIWFLMRLGRRGDERRVLWLVRFFEEWCDDEMMGSRAKMHVAAILKGGFEPEAAFSYTQALAQTQKLCMADSHDLIQTTRGYLIKNKPELVNELQPSDLDITFEILQNWFIEKNIEGIEKLIPICSKLLHTDFLKILSEFNNQDEIFNFWLQKIPIIANTLGNIYIKLNSPEIDKAEKSWNWAANAGNFDAMFNLGLLYQKEMKDLEKAIKWYEKVANAGNSNAMVNLGFLYEKEMKDFEKAIEWFEKGANAGNSKAMFNLGFLYENEMKDFEKAIEWYEKAANAGDSNAKFNLGILYQSEMKDFEKAIEWYEKAANTSDSEAMVNLGILYEKETKDFEKAIEWFEKGANAGNSDAMFNLGLLYQKEIKNLEKAIEWYEKGANIGNSNAMVNLGVLYENEMKDLEKAIEWYEKAANAGDSDAKFNLGLLYQKEIKNLEKAIEWYEKGANAGNSNAMVNLGILYENEMKDFEKAIEWYEKGANAGNSNAMVNLGLVYIKEMKDFEKAIEWLEKGGNAGNSDAMFNLGLLYQKEMKDFENAIEWYEKGANAGNSNAMVNLGVLSVNEIKNFEKAIEWYEKGANAGNSDAMFHLGLLYQKEMKNVEKAIEWYEKSANISNPDAMNAYAWVLFEQKIYKQKALSWIESSLKLKPENDWIRHSAAIIYAWNNQIEASKTLFEFLKNEELLEKEPDDIITYFILMIAKKESAWLLEQFNSAQGESVHLKDRFKPIYYAILKQLDHPDFLRIGDEIRQTVDEILKKAEQMAIDYA